jgi:ABC-type antimicrobial peptide transport system permease subunit
MLQHNILPLCRSFKKYYGTFCINLIGLSTGLTAALFIYLWVNDELTVDKFHEKDRQLFQVMKNTPTSSGIYTMEGTPARLAEALAKEMPDVEYAASVTNSDWSSGKGLIAYNGTRINAEGQFVSKDYFNVFSYSFLQGDQKTALSDKYNILLSEDLAMKLFNTTEDVVGKIVEWKHEGLDGLFTVSGIYKQLPPNASLKSDILLNYELFLERNPKLENWLNSDPSTYLVLRKNTDVDQFNTKISGFIKSKNKDAEATLFLQRYSEKYLHNRYENGKPTGGRMAYVTLFMIVALFILLNACINFMNLSTAKAMRRFKEVGVRKVMGAKRRTLVLQFLLESMLMTALSLGVAMVLIRLFLPWFSEVTGKQLSLGFDPRLILGTLAITILTGIVSGSYPSLYLSNFNPVAALKGKLNTYIGELWTRKGLVLFQSMISVVLIISTWIVYKQIELVQTKNLGYVRDNIVYFEMGADDVIKDKQAFEADLELRLQEIKKIPGVINATNFRHSITNRQGGTTDIAWEGKDADNAIEFTDLAGGYDFIETLGIEMKEGRSYSRNFASEESKVVLNEKAVEVMGLKDPVGKVIRIWNEDQEIIGVTKNFHFQSLYEEIKPLFFDLSLNKRVSKIMVKIKAGSERETLEQLRRLYAVHNPGIAFEYSFLDSDYQALYESENRVAILSKYFAAISIVISCLGLFGLAVFTAERKKKEIGIRKVLGSSVSRIVYLLTSEFFRTVFIAILIAFPVSYIIAQKWLDSFAYKIELTWWHFAGTGMLVLIVTGLTVGLQAVKAALANPAKSLKDE